jgi:hypothetical protein
VNFSEPDDIPTTEIYRGYRGLAPGNAYASPGLAPAKPALRRVFCFKGVVMFYTYILYSHSIDKYYVGYTEDPDWRLERHNSGWGKFSSIGIS